MPRQGEAVSPVISPVFVPLVDDVVLVFRTVDRAVGYLAGGNEAGLAAPFDAEGHPLTLSRSGEGASLVPVEGAADGPEESAAILRRALLGVGVSVPDSASISDLVSLAVVKFAPPSSGGEKGANEPSSWTSLTRRIGSAILAVGFGMRLASVEEAAANAVALLGVLVIVVGWVGMWRSRGR